MTPLTALELEFADGTYLFDLRLPQIGELQEKRKAGIFAIYGRVMKGRYNLGGEQVALTQDAEAFAEDLFETIRLGLIGGARGTVAEQTVAVDATLARKLVERYCHPAPLRESWAIAAAILGARIEGYDPGPNVEAGGEPAIDHETTSTSPSASPTAQ